jgi:hypothetical protein
LILGIAFDYFKKAKKRAGERMNTVQHHHVVNISTDRDSVVDGGAQAITRLNPSIVIPHTAVDVKVGLRSSFIYNSFPNVDVKVGNALYVKTQNMSDYAIIIIPDGQYDVTNLDSTIQYQIANTIHNDEILGIFEIVADLATQTIAIDNTSADKTIDFFFAGPDHVSTQYQPLSIYNLLGFNAESTVTVNPKQNINAPNTANFNNVNIIRPICNLLQNGILVGGRSLGILADIPINNTPGSQMVYQPNPEQTDVSEPSLVGTSIREISILLTNEKGESIRTIGNEWSITIAISYKATHQ